MQAKMLARGVAVGRSFPTLEKMMRVTVGTDAGDGSGSARPSSPRWKPIRRRRKWTPPRWVSTHSPTLACTLALDAARHRRAGARPVVDGGMRSHHAPDLRGPAAAHRLQSAAPPALLGQRIDFTCHGEGAYGKYFLGPSSIRPIRPPATERTFSFFLFDSETARPLARVRKQITSGKSGRGAAPGYATDLLASPDASTLGVIGSGFQAQSQIDAIRCVRDLTDIRVLEPQPGEARSIRRRPIRPAPSTPLKKPCAARISSSPRRPRKIR